MHDLLIAHKIFIERPDIVARKSEFTSKAISFVYTSCNWKTYKSILNWNSWNPFPFLF